MKMESPHAPAPNRLEATVPKAFGMREKIIAMAGWTVALTLLWLWSWHEVESQTVDLARAHARALVEKDVLYRRWNAGHGGVYVPMTRETPPDPDLEVPEKNVETTSGLRLTLVNPAFMNRQVHALRSPSGTLSRLTSLPLLRPENVPDPWEERGLEVLERGALETGAVQEVNGQAVYRYMATVMTESIGPRPQESHRDDGPVAISITVPFEPYLKAQKEQKVRQGMLFGLVWLLGVAGMVVGFHLLRARERALADHQRELQHKNLFLHTVLDSIQDGISVLNRDLSVRLTNKVMEKWYATRLPLAGRKCHEVYHLREKPCDPCPSRRALTSGKPEVELVPGPSNGHVKWLELHAYPLKNPETGDTEGIVEFVRDVTERMEAQEALRRIHAAVEQAQNFIVITDAHGGIVYVNPYFEKYTGYSLDQVRGALPLVFQSLADGERVFREEVLPELHKGMVWSKTMHAFIQDGSKVHVDLTASPVLDDAGRLVNIVFVARDVTREKQLESQLFQAQKMESVGQLAGGIAHDFNNLLQIINGYADMALNRLEAPHPVHRYLQRIREAGERAASLVQQLLAFSRRQVMDPKPLDLNGLIEDLLTMLTRLLGEHIVIRFEPEPSLDLIYGDKTMLEQVVINLCVNARDAMPEGGDLVLETHDVTVDEAFCKKHPWAKPGRYALMSVSDTGHGMDAATIQRIFDPFFTTKEMGRGTGLGLATVYGVVKQHQGMIHVYSEPGMGSTFKIYLPLAPAEVSTGAKKDRPQSAVQGGREVILVAEDNREVLEFVSETLRNFGYTVVEAHNGAEVVAIMEKDPRIQLVILDVVMPEMSGWEAYTALKAMRPEVPVLFMSGYTENVVHTNFVAKSGCRLIQKPFTPEKLLHEIQKILQEKSGHP